MQTLCGRDRDALPENTPKLALRHPLCIFVFDYDAGIKPTLFNGFKEPFDSFGVIAPRIPTHV